MCTDVHQLLILHILLVSQTCAGAVIGASTAALIGVTTIVHASEPETAPEPIKYRQICE